MPSRVPEPTDPTDPTDVAASVRRRILRGLLRRCPRCGAKGIFVSTFRLAERCPTCGYRFAREPGFFTGVYLLNYSLTAVLLFVVVMVYVFWRGLSGPTVPVWPFVAAGLAVCVVVPVAFYPTASSLWAALDLLMRPLDPEETADAETYRTAQSPRPGP